MKKFITSLIEKYPRLWEIFKFLVVGGFATIVDFFIMGLVMFLLAHDKYDNSFFNVLFKSTTYQRLIPSYIPIIGTICGFVGGVIFNYIFSILFVFKETGFAKKLQGMLLFLLFAVIGLLIHIVGMWIGVDLADQNYWLVKIVLTILVLIFNYISRKVLIFNENRRPSKDITS